MNEMHKIMTQMVLRKIATADRVRIQKLLAESKNKGYQIGSYHINDKDIGFELVNSKNSDSILLS
jgi:hypothetical protein